MSAYRNILVATDFSPHAEAAVQQGLWLAERCGGRLVIAHVLTDITRVMLDASSPARWELMQGDPEVFQREVRKASDERLQQLIAALPPSGISATGLTLLGEPFVEIIHAVQQDGFDLVLTGTRGRAGWKRLLVGSTATRLVRKCPSSVWVVRSEQAEPPKIILAPTDFSEISRRAVEQAAWLAGLSQATLYVLHVIDGTDTPDNAFEKLSAGTTRQSLRRQIRKRAKKKLEEFLGALPNSGANLQPRLTWGTPWREIVRLARNLKADLVAMGTVGRSGIPGLLLGNTAEKVLTMCKANLLSVKPAGFVSPIAPPFWRLHPEQEEAAKASDAGLQASASDQASPD